MKWSWLKSKLFLGTALIEPEPQPKMENRYESTGKQKKCKIHYANYRTKEGRDRAPRSTEQYPSRGIRISRAHSLRLCNNCLK